MSGLGVRVACQEQEGFQLLKSSKLWGKIISYNMCWIKLSAEYEEKIISGIQDFKRPL